MLQIHTYDTELRPRSREPILHVSAVLPAVLAALEAGRYAQMTGETGKGIKRADVDTLGGISQPSAQRSCRR